MTDKEKLFELIGQVQDCGCDVTDVVKMTYVENNVLIDHLIKNGVTIQKRGRWIPASDVGDCCYRCNVCGKVIDHYCDEDDNYCSRCGAKMDLEVAL